MTKRTHHSLLAMIVGEPMMIDVRGMEMILTIAAREVVSPELLSAYLGPDRDPTHLDQYPGPEVDRSNNMSRRGDVAVIPIYGPIMRHASMFSRMSGATTTETIAQDVGVALQDPTIKAMVLKINSPGGQAAGIGELAGIVREADGQKPITAYVEYMGTSAANYIAAGASRIVANKSSFVGSIGTISAWTSDKAAKEALGLKDIVVVSPQTPRKGIDPESDEGLAELQAQLGYLTDHFIADMATYRNTSQKKVREDFGQGGVLDSTRALEVGLIDDLGTFEQVIGRVLGGRRYRKSSSPSASVGSSSGVSAMPRKTWAEWLMGDRAHQEIPASLDSPGEESSPSPEARGGTKDPDDPAELRRQLAAEKQARLDAESRAHGIAVASERVRIEAMVKGWKGKSIHPSEEAAELAHCLRLAEVDREQGLTGDRSLLESHRKRMESPSRGLSLLDEVVVDQKPPKGGRIESPPVAPDAATAADPWAEDRASLKETAAEVAGVPGSSSNGLHK